MAIVTPQHGSARDIVDRLAGIAPGGLWAGLPTYSMTEADVRHRLLVADNDAALFAGTLRSVVAGAADTAGVATESAATSAAADDIIDGLDGGWDGQVTTDGGNLSGGQWQRLRLARAIAASPEVLLAVDPTSALDAHTEGLVAQRLRQTRHGLTTVITTTSPVLLDKADLVHWVVDGVVVGSGRHVDLLSQPRYAELVERGGGST